MRDQLYQLIADVTECDPHSLTDASTPETTPGWDSLSTIKLIFEIEECFDIELSMSDVMDMTSVKRVREIIHSKQHQDA